MEGGERLFVTRIPPNITREDIATHFAQFGSTTDVYLPAVPDNKECHKGIAFISFQEPAAAQLAISNGPHLVGGNELVVEIAAPKGHSKGQAKGQAKGKAPASQQSAVALPLVPQYAIAPPVVHAQAWALPTPTPSGDRLFVTKVPPELSQDDMMQHFSQFGETTDVYMPAVPGSGTHKGICFISFADPASLPLAMEHQPHEIQGHTVVLDVAAPRGEKGSKGGKGDKGGSHQAVAAPFAAGGKGWGYSGGMQAAAPSTANGSEGTPVPGRLFLTKVPHEVTRDDLASYFQQYGELKDVFVPSSGKGIAFVSMADPEVLHSILQTQQHFVKPGVSVTVDQAIDRPPLVKGGKEGGKGGGGQQGFYQQQARGYSPY